MAATPTSNAPTRPASHTLYSALLSAAGAEAIPTIRMDKHAVFRLLNNVGKAMVLEQIATGQLPNEVALHYGVPILVFREWLEQNVQEAEMMAARVACAESLQLKATLVLSADLKNPAEASQAKALAERFSEQAKSIDPKGWSPAHLQPQATRPIVNITFTQPDGRVDMVIEGTVEQGQTAAPAGSPPSRPMDERVSGPAGGAFPFLAQPREAW
jgi:hypothetical protein